MLIMDKQGRPLTMEKSRRKDPQSIFSKVLNRPLPTIEAEIQDPDTDLDVSTSSPEKQIMATIRALKN